MTFCIYFFLLEMYLQGEFLGVRWLGQRVNVCWYSFSKLSSVVIVPFCTLTSNVWGHLFFHSFWGEIVSQWILISLYDWSLTYFNQFKGHLFIFFVNCLRIVVFNHSTNCWVPFFFFFLRAAPAAYGSSQARGWIGAATASLHRSRCNAVSKPHLWPLLQLAVTMILFFFFYSIFWGHSHGIWRFPG